MQHITGTDRDQLFFTSLAQDISSDNPVRFIEAFVEQIDLLRLGFQLQTIKTEGRPSFATKLFFKNIFVWISQWFAQQSQIRTRVPSQYRAAMAYPKTSA